MRLLKLLRWIHELNVILHSIASSALAIFYVYVLIFGLAYHFAVAGVFLFARNDPQHFKDLSSSFVTLFQVQSLDDWSEIARTNMYGCDFWGYDTGEDYYDEQCSSPHGLGWFAALYFVMYIMMSVMVLLSLFIGIIITSMELLKEGLKEENEVWEKVKIQQKKYNMRDATINNLLEIFDLIDTGMNGKLTLTELKPIFDIITISEASQFSLYMMVDTDNSGQIDFAEFLELLYLVGKAYKAQNRNKRNKTKNKPAPMITRTASAKGFALAVKSKLTGSNAVVPENKYRDDKDVDERSGNSENNSSPIEHDDGKVKKAYSKKLSLVTDEDDDFVDQLKANYVSDDDYSETSEPSHGKAEVKGKELLTQSFFRKEIQKHHSTTGQEAKGDRSSCGSSIDDDLSCANSISDVPPSAEKQSLNFSFFQKQQAAGDSAMTPQSMSTERINETLVYPQVSIDAKLSKQLSDTFEEDADLKDTTSVFKSSDVTDA
jgi:voltage-gated sodium channel